VNKIGLSVFLAVAISACDGGAGLIDSADGNGQTNPGQTDNGDPNQNTGEQNTNNENPDNQNTGNEQVVNPNAAIASRLNATHRSGQTFIVWQEPDGNTNYHVYRHNSPITSSNLSSATKLTNRWGALDQNIQDSQGALADSQGLFVNTTQNNTQGNAYYAVTSVINGQESTRIDPGKNATTQAVNESVSTPRPVLTVSSGGGRVYTQYMDYSRWNPTLNGYAYNFAVALPAGYNRSNSYPLMVEFHAYGELHKFVDQAEYNWPVIQLFPSDPGEGAGTTHSWWYGYAADHNYKTQGGLPNSGKVENFTEQRVIAAINFLVNDGQFNVDRNYIHSFGHSMGGSGALAYALRYPSLFAGIYASEPMTNYASSPVFQENFTRLWGSKAQNLPIVNNGPNNSDIRNYGAGGSQATNVWDWMNHQQQIKRRSTDRFGYLMIDHGKQDTTIDWATQGRPMARVLSEARVGFSATAVGGVGHNWLGFDGVVTSVFGFGFGDEAGWRYPRSLSFPSITYATGSGSIDPSSGGTDRYNKTIEWSTPRNSFHQSIVDSSNRYEISLRSTSGNQTAQITPRNTNAFKPSAGRSCSWNVTDIGSNGSIGSGNATVANSGLLTITGVQIRTGQGSRLSISC